MYVVKALANGDVQTLKRYTTKGFRDAQFSATSDAALHREMLSVPTQRRQKLLDHIVHYAKMKVKYIDDTQAMVECTNTQTYKTSTFYLNKNYGIWQVDDYLNF